MDEFNRRMALQRRVLHIVNSSDCFAFQLCGLTQGSISRWREENVLDRDSEVATQIGAIAEVLQFMYGRSQEQIVSEATIEATQIEGMIARLTKICETLERN